MVGEYEPSTDTTFLSKANDIFFLTSFPTCILGEKQKSTG